MTRTDWLEYGGRHVGAYKRQLGLAEYQGKSLVFCQSIFVRNETGYEVWVLYNLV
jgi:hypothetical protein